MNENMNDFSDFDVVSEDAQGFFTTSALREGFYLADTKTGVKVTMYRGHDGALVVQVDTDEVSEGTDPRIRVNVNDGAVYDGHAESGKCYDLR